jgi:hypothetical protein
MQQLALQLESKAVDAAKMKHPVLSNSNESSMINAAPTRATVMQEVVARLSERLMVRAESMSKHSAQIMYNGKRLESALINYGI